MLFNRHPKETIMKLKTLIPAFGAYMIASTVQAQETAIAVPTDSVFILNSLLFLIGGFLVFWMAAGFSMLEGSVCFKTLIFFILNYKTI